LRSGGKQILQFLKEHCKPGRKVREKAAEGGSREGRFTLPPSLSSGGGGAVIRSVQKTG